jgi:ABC-type uncharacterized transport system involved in gliding motility auxiliary subunit
MATQATQQKKRRVATQTGLYLAVLVAIAVLVNWLVATSTTRWDTTKTERYTLSQGSARLVRSLREPIQVDAYVTTGGIARLDSFVRDLTDLLREYAGKSNGKFEFTLIQANTEELRDQAKDAGLEPMTFASQKTDQASIAQGYMGLVFKYGSEKDTIPQLNPSRTDGLEFWITNKIRELKDKAEDVKLRIGIVSGKDELKFSDNNLVARQGRQGSPSIEQIIQQAFPFYKTESVEIKEGEPIDEKLSGLIITQPGKDYTDQELRRVDEFLMHGGKSLVVIASAVSLKAQDATMQASLNLHNLDKLIAGYGINMKKNAVLDFGANFSLPVLTATGNVTQIRNPGILRLYNDPRLDKDKALLDTGFAAFFRMEEISFPFASELELMPNKQPKGVEVFAVARSTPQSSVTTESTVDMSLKPQWEPKPPMKQRIVAAVAKGKLKSAFPKSDSIKANEQAPAPSRVLVISSSLFLTNPFAYAGNGQEMGGQFQMMGSIGGDRQLQAIANPYAQRYLTNTILVVKNMFDWMTGDSDLIATSAKILSEPNLTYASIAEPDVKPGDDEAEIRRKDEEYRKAREGLQQKVQWSLTAGVPAIFAGLGLARWRRRESARTKRRASEPRKSPEKQGR